MEDKAGRVGVLMVVERTKRKIKQTGIQIKVDKEGKRKKRS